jgi:hypothetical protein
MVPRCPGVLHLAGAVLVEAHDEWHVSDRRYLSEGSVAQLDQPAEEAGAAELIASSSPHHSAEVTSQEPSGPEG